MPAIRPEATATKQQAIQAARHAHGDTAQPAGEARATLGFDDQVHMIGLHGVVRDSKRLPIAVTQRAKHRAHDWLAAETTQTSAECDVHGMSTSVVTARTMRCVPQMRRQRFSTRTATRAAMPKRKRELQLPRLHHPLPTT